jgi:HD superfamily phosphohydrolase
MYSSVYFHRTARIAEGMLCRAGEYLSDEDLEQVWGMADGEVLRFMREKGGVPSRMAARLRFRKLLKSAFTINSEDAVGESETAIRTRELVARLTDDK